MTDGPKSFEWDDAKSDACFEERGFSFADVLMIFTGPVIERPDDRKDYGEPRIRAAGLIEGVPFMVVYTPRGDGIRIISARKMHRKGVVKMARMTLAEIKARTSSIDWKRVNATTDEDIDRHAKEDGTDNELPGLPYPTPATVRRHLKLTQKEIAALAGVPVATWRNWEQGRVGLDPAVRTLLRVLWREPDAVRRAMVA